MNAFNIVLRHATKKYEINVSIKVNKLQLENQATKWEAIKN